MSSLNTHKHTNVNILNTVSKALGKEQHTNCNERISNIAVKNYEMNKIKIIQFYKDI